jgi:hypothetical protein
MAKRDGYSTLMIEVPEALHATIKEVADEAGVPMKTLAEILLRQAIGGPEQELSPEARVARAIKARLVGVVRA